MHSYRLLGILNAYGIFISARQRMCLALVRISALYAIARPSNEDGWGKQAVFKINVPISRKQ